MRTEILSALCREEIADLSKVVGSAQTCRRVRILVKEILNTSSVASIVDGELRVSIMDWKIRVPVCWLLRENEPIVVAMES